MNNCIFLTIQLSFLQLYFEIEQKQVGTCAQVTAAMLGRTDHRKSGLNRISQVISLTLASKVPTINKDTKVPNERCWKLTLPFECTKWTWIVCERAKH